MKLSGYLTVFLLISNTGLVHAQDESAEAEQQAAIREAAVAINNDCPAPSGPAMPDGSTASEEAMLSTQAALKAYIEDGNVYLGCLEDAEAGLGAGITDTQKAVVDYLYNSMVESMQSSAAAFNTQLQIYRDRSAE